MVKIRKTHSVNFSYNLKTYWKFLSKYKIYMSILLVSLFFFAVASVADKYLLKNLIDDAGKLSSLSISAEMFLKFAFIIAILYGVIILTRTLTQVINIHFINKLEANIMVDLKRHFFNHVIRLSYNFHTTHKTGSLISRLSRGNGAMERITDFFIFQTFPLLFQLILVSAALFYADRLSAILTLVTVTVFLGYSLFILKIQNKLNIEYNNSEDTEKANMGDFFTNIESIKYFAKENFIIKRFRDFTEKTKKNLLAYWNYYKFFDPIHTLILGTGTIFVLAFPIIKFSKGQMSIGDVIFTYTIFGNLFNPLFGFVYQVKGFYSSMADFESLFRYDKIHNEIKDKPNAINLQINKGEVEFRSVSFAYNKRKILSNFSLKINKNEKVALVGHSGSGKTTLVKLLYRMYDTDKGKILIDEIDSKNVTQESLRNELSIVPQECVLFDDTIYNNISFSNHSATRKEVFAAMKFAQLDKFISRLPKKENTIVGERGIKLSGGEKQRVSIARAILANKKVLVLDEATSSLDSKTESQIQKGLWRLMQGRTTIIIAHRLSTIMKADKIVVLDKGRISQIGNHKELIGKPGLYQELWNLQKGGYIN